MASITKVVPEVAPNYVLELTEEEMIYLKIVLGALSPKTDEELLNSSTVPVALARSYPTAKTAQDIWTVVNRELPGVYNNQSLVVK